VENRTCGTVDAGGLMSRALVSIVVALICGLWIPRAFGAEVTVTIAGADKVTLTLPAGEKPTVAWKQTYYAYVDSAPADATVEKVAVQKLQDSTGGQKTLDATVDPADGNKLPIGAPIVVTLTATIDKAGTYTTNLRVSAAGKVATKTITVEVVAAAAASAVVPADVLSQVDKGAKQFEDGDWPWPSVENRRTIVLTVRNTTPKEVVVKAPTVVVTKKTKSGHSVDVSSRATVISVGTTNVATGAKEATIPADATARVALQIDKLDSPGHFDGVVRLVPTDTSQKPIDLGFELFLRHGWWLCSLLILFGAVAAYWVRNWQDTRRKSEVRRIELASVAERLFTITPGAATEQALALGRGLQVQARTIALRIDRGDEIADDATSPIKLLAKRVALYDRFVGVDAAIARLPQATRDVKRADLDKVAIVIANGDSADAAITQGGKDLDDIKERDAERKYLESWLASLAGDAASHALASDVELAKGISSEVEPALEVARGAARRDDLTKLRATLERAQRTLISLGTDALGRGLKAAAQGVDANAWSTLTAELANKILKLSFAGDIDKLITDYAEIRLAYLTAIANGTVAVADEHIKGASAARGQQLTALKDVIETTLKASPVDPTALLRATNALREALRADGVPIAGRRDEYRAGEIAARPAETEAPVSRVALSPDGAVAMDWKKLQERMKKTDRAVFVVVTAIGILAGLKLLWVGDATWGGWADAITALLWGAGVNASKDGFMGLLKLRNDLGKVT
jgi:PKD repeat protein